MLSSFPLMTIALIAYNVLVFGVGIQGLDWDTPVFELNMVSGTPWKLRFSDTVIVLGLILLFFEILKATRIGRLSIVDHLLSTVVFILFLIEFLLIPQAATSVFFILMLITLIDVLAGFSVSIRTATRDVSFGEGAPRL